MRRLDVHDRRLASARHSDNFGPLGRPLTGPGSPAELEARILTHHREGRTARDIARMMRRPITEVMAVLKGAR